MNDMAAALHPDATAPGLSQGERIIDTFIAPSKTFEDIRRSASWWLPFLLMVVLGYAFTFAMQKKIGFAQLVENTIRMNPKAAERMANVPPEQAAQQKKVMEYGFKATFYAYPLFILAFFAFCAVILWATVNFGLGGVSKYSQVLAVIVYAWLPSILKSILITVMIFAGGDPDTFDLNNPVGTNPGFFLGPDSAAWLKSLLSSLDIFTIWSLVLLAIGLAIVARVKRGSAMAAVFGWFIIILFVKTAYTAFAG